MNRSPIFVERKLQPDIEHPYGYIYITTNSVNEKQYIGQHRKIEFDKKYIGSGVVLQRAIKKYGKENFRCEPIDWAETKEELDQKELNWIDFLDCVSSVSFYNRADGGEGHTSEEAKRFITEHTIELYKLNSAGSNNPMYGKGYKLQGSKNGMYGRTHSDEVKRKLSESASKRIADKNPFFGRHHDELTKSKLSQVNTGRKHSEEWKEQASKERMGKVWVNDNWSQERFIHFQEVEAFLGIGWILGRLSYENKHKFLFLKSKGDNVMKKDLSIKIRYHEELYGELKHVEKIDKGDWIDLMSAEDVDMKQGDFRLISLGVSMELPQGYEAHIATRSSTYKTWGVLMANSHGIIDESYKGDGDIWKFPALAMRDTHISKGDRICQFRLVEKMEQIELIEVEELTAPNRGGIGSTGKQ